MPSTGSLSGCRDSPGGLDSAWTPPAAEPRRSDATALNLPAQTPPGIAYTPPLRAGPQINRFRRGSNPQRSEQPLLWQSPLWTRKYPQAIVRQL
jgi:hypothetical protein